ncbi:MAG: hypothetical protein QOK48_2912 [Blastocatellia bacterium]|nr:hypothetical protein [Blastocatellia bacterium]
MLGSLRYVPKPLEIPAHIQPGRRRSFSPGLAIAAAIALFAVLFGLWFGFNRKPAPALTANNNPPPSTSPLSTPGPAVSSINETQTAQVQTPKQPQVIKHAASFAGQRIHGPRIVNREPLLTPQELAEKEQVLVALRLVSFKLNLAKGRTQGAPQLNSIRNQHRIG